MGNKREAFKMFILKPEEERSLGRHRHRWENKIKIEFREVISGVYIGFIWLSIDLWRSLLNTVVNLRDP
jgi:hypothetical protein